VFESPDKSVGAAMDFPKRFWQVGRCYVKEHPGGKNKIKEAIGNFKRCRQRAVCVLQPGPRLGQRVVLDFDPVEVLESHFPQRAQMLALIAAYLEDARVPRYFRQETLVEFSPADPVIPAVESVESVGR